MRLLRFPGIGKWYAGMGANESERVQKRLGGRMALFATVTVLLARNCLTWYVPPIWRQTMKDIERWIPERWDQIVGNRALRRAASLSLPSAGLDVDVVFGQGG